MAEWLSLFQALSLRTLVNLIDLTGIFFSLGCLVLWHHHQTLPSL